MFRGFFLGTATFGHAVYKFFHFPIFNDLYFSRNRYIFIQFWLNISAYVKLMGIKVRGRAAGNDRIVLILI